MKDIQKASSKSMIPPAKTLDGYKIKCEGSVQEDGSLKKNETLRITIEAIKGRITIMISSLTII